MANLRWFRKHQKIMLVFFGVILMAVFGLGSVVSMMPNAPSDRDTDRNKVIANWKGGRFTRGELAELTRMHFYTMEFINELDRSKMGKEGVNFTRAVDLIPTIQTAGAPPEEIDNQIITRILLAERAKELGLFVGDEEVNSYVQKLSYTQLTFQEMQAVNARVNQGAVDIKQILGHLKTELMFMKMAQMIGQGIPAMPHPAEAFEYYLKLNRRIECQVAAFPVENYLSKVTGEPSKKELKALFEEGKYDYPDPTHKEPGFKKQRELIIQYFVADTQAFLDIETAKLTPEEVLKEYNRLVEARDPIVIDNITNDDEKDPSDSDPEKTGDDSAPAPGETKTGDDKKADDKKADDKKADDKKAEEKKADDKKGEEKKVEEKKSSSVEPAEKPVYTSLSPQEKQDGKQENSDKKSGDGAPKPPGKTDESKSDGKSGQDKKGDSKSGETKAGESKAGDVGSENKQDPVPGIDEEKPKTRIKELKEVEKEIRERLKRDDATKARDQALKRAAEEIEIHMIEVEAFENSKDEEDDPGVFDIKKHADRLKLGYHTTKPVNFDTVADTEIGKVQTFFVNAMQRPVLRSIGEKLFGNFHGIRKFEAMQDNDFMNGKTYLYWVTEKIDPTVLKFEDAKEKVVEYWRYKEAQKLAKADAQAFADKVAKNKVAMDSIDAEKTVKTGSFSWFQSTGSQFNQRPGVQYGIPIGVESPGEEFMGTAFSLDTLETGVAMNLFNEIVYAVQVTEKIEPLDGQPLRRKFLAEMNRFQRIPTGIPEVSQRYAGEISRDWFDAFSKEMELEFVAY